jgi:hypothetical protein
MRTAFVLLAGAFMAVGSAFAQVGEFTLEGAYPGGASPYTGKVTVVPAGDVFKVSWSVGGSSYSGLGIGDDSALAIAFSTAGGEAGVALFQAQDDGSWVGSWAFPSNNQAGSETWHPQ